MSAKGRRACSLIAVHLLRFLLWFYWFIVVYSYVGKTKPVVACLAGICLQLLAICSFCPPSV